MRRRNQEHEFRALRISYLGLRNNIHIRHFTLCISTKNVSNLLLLECTPRTLKSDITRCRSAPTQLSRLKQHSRRRIQNFKLNIGHILRIDSIKKVHSPAITRHHVSMIKILAQIILELLIRIARPPNLHAHQTVFSDVICIKTYAYTSRERHTAQICILARTTRRERTDSWVRKETIPIGNASI